MAEDVKANIVNKIVYGALAGFVGGVIEAILGFLASSLNLGNADDIEITSQLVFGTTPGNPDLVGYFIVEIMGFVVGGIIFGIIIFLLLTRAGWERDRTRYLIVAIVVVGVFFLLAVITLITSITEWDLLVDTLIVVIKSLITALIIGLTFYYLEERFESAS